MTTTHLYVFGPRASQHPDYTPSSYTCLYHTQAVSDADLARVEGIAAEEIAAGREAYLHRGETVGRDQYPVAPAHDLAAALRRAGWLVSYCPDPEDRERATAHGIPVA